MAELPTGEEPPFFAQEARRSAAARASANILDTDVNGFDTDVNDNDTDVNGLDTDVNVFATDFVTALVWMVMIVDLDDSANFTGQSWRNDNTLLKTIRLTDGENRQTN